MKIWPFLLFLFWSAAQGFENQLADSPSPYLAMHGHDPVQWRPWSQAVLDEARRSGKPIFLSSGYFSCHWCHVMHRESYTNPEIAALLNRWFIPVKIDRELDPALDEHLIDFVQRTSGRAGWPLNVFLTPEGYPLAGFTYAPPGRFKTILERFHRLWNERRDQVTRLAREALAALEQARREEAVAKEKPLSAAQLGQRFVERAMALADTLDGGFGQQNRFPMQPQLATLLKLQKAYGNDDSRDFLDLTLTQMATLGLRDHLGGGFFRYTVDLQWHRPHYEKMLYTQALLALLYLEAAERLHNPAWRQVAFDTLDFTLREVAGHDGGYVASFSAVDDKDREGGYYLWTGKQLKAVLNPGEYRLALRHWRFPDLEKSEDGVLPLQGESAATLAKAEGVSLETMRARLAAIRAKLLEARSRRGLPVDHKQLAGWNGLLLAALAKAVQMPGGERYAKPAARLANYLVTRHWQKGKLLRAVDAQGRGYGQAALEDYAYLAWGLAAWSEAGRDGAAGRLANKLIDQAWRRFHDQRGWHSSDSAPLPGMPAREAQSDGALPAPAAVLLRLSLARSGAPAEKARRSLSKAWPVVQKNPFWHASLTALLVKSPL